MSNGIDPYEFDEMAEAAVKGWDNEDEAAVLDSDDAYHRAFTMSPGFEAEEASRAAFEERRAYEQWRADRLVDDPETPESELTEEVWADELVGRAEARYEA